MDELGMAMAEPDADFDALMAEMGEVQTELDHRNAWDIDSQLEQAMDALRCPPPDAMVDVLSGGERRRVALCKLLLQQPDLLLLDEPTNHLDAESVQWLEGHLKAYPGAVLAVTHDRYFLDNVAQWILEIDRGRTHPYEGNYSTYLDTKKTRLQIEGKRDAKRAKILERELEWARSNPKARQAKNKARLQRYEELATEAERNRKLDFEEINIPSGPRLGSTVLEAADLVKGFGDRLLFDGLSFSLPRAGIVGVVGPNGVGKSTLFRMIVGEETPDSGSLRIGETVKISYVDQARSGLDPRKNVWELVSDGLDHIKVGNFEMPSRAYVASFGFKGPDQQKPAGVLSGGERNRLNLALTLKIGGNLLLLDEPTNDLDVETLQSLEDALLEFPGCAVVISHDRWFLDRVVDPHPGLGGRRRGPGEVVLVRGQLRRLRGEQDRPARRRGRPAAPGHPSPADPLMTREVPSQDLPDPDHTTPDGVSDATVDALGKLSEALETCERARGHLYSFHQLTGSADIELGEAVSALREAGHTEVADRIDRELVGRNVIADRWTFQIVEDYDDNYWSLFRELERDARDQLADGVRHLYEARLKQSELTPGEPGHEAERRRASAGRRAARRG